MPDSSYAAAAIDLRKSTLGRRHRPRPSRWRIRAGRGTWFGYGGVTVEMARTRTGSAMPWRLAYSIDDSTMAAPPSDVAQMSSSRSGSATIGDASTSSAVTSLRYRALGLLSPWRGVLHLHLGEVLGGGAVQVHAPPGVQREVRGVGRADQPEPQPVGIVPPLARGRREEALGRGVGADDERDVAQTGEDAHAGLLERGATRRAGRVATSRRGRRSSPGPGRRWRRRRSRRTRCARSRRRRRTATSCQSTPASASAARAATMPYSTKWLAPLAPRVHARPRGRRRRFQPSVAAPSAHGLPAPA